MFKFKSFNGRPHISFSTHSATSSSLTLASSSLSAPSSSSTSAKCCSLCPLYKNILCLIIGLIIGIRFTDIWFNLQNETLTTILPATATSTATTATTTTTTLTSSFSSSLEANDNLFNTTRVLCWILTNPTNHLTKAIHIRHTWGRRCNKLLFMSSKEDNDLPTIKLDVEEGRENLWNKTRLALKYIYDHHIDDAEWFLKADDDTYVIMENLRYFLYQYPPEAAIYFGAKFKRFVKQGYMSGGAGYVLSREALKKFATEAYDDPDKCGESYEAEDVQLGMCLENAGVIAGDSRDEEGNERFLPLPIEYLIPEDKTWWYKNYSYYPQKENATCCSPSAISFHYIVADQLYVLDYFLYTLRVVGIYNNFILPKKIPLSNILTEGLDNFEPIPEPPVDIT
ncbi:LOW QUALITY PROTEIN: glycoprotein-N-acetylgalactosamine 3-beta-galactosyltransferase 1-like [Lucilia sericata]|uniref:LOW QUALITY PROTEIN: glycoprotein-N-acetylgalactosamine 3-beta-galactosyltransferase 1-like n=1 Tax=Lucilia sericata TaxID=13632 RepID=UPI0018A82EDD|nr:LOW QUALITY PROTEIN: glycoprotein-N-acetylgalactosamine 3-beta-galactosyltransferase 1-like [Lucilia sericata]